MKYYYDRKGKAITLDEWSLLHSDPEYMTLAVTTVGPYKVSTVWLGLDHRFNLLNGQPLIFETMIFSDCGEDTDDCWRYSTEADAYEGHADAIRKTIKLEKEDNGNVDD